MKNSKLTNPLKMLAACALLASAASGFAATTWTPGLGCTNNAACTDPTVVGSKSGAVTGVNDAGTTSAATTVTASAYAVSNAKNPDNSASKFVAATLYDYSPNHLGVLSAGETGSSPDHSLDNNVNTELISLKFSSSIALTSVTTAWAGAQSGQTIDSDMSLLAYTGGVAGFDIKTYDITGKTISDLMNQGWTLVATIDGTSSSTGATYANLNKSGITSSWWLVSAYNSGYGGSTSLSAGNDYTKLLSVAGNVVTPPGNKVPEPGSLALMGAAFCAALAVRRRQTKSV